MTVLQISNYRRRKTRLRIRHAHRHRLDDRGSSGLLIACVMILACVVLFFVVGERAGTHQPLSDAGAEVATGVPAVAGRCDPIFARCLVPKGNGRLRTPGLGRAPNARSVLPEQYALFTPIDVGSQLCAHTTTYRPRDLRRRVERCVRPGASTAKSSEALCASVPARSPLRLLRSVVRFRPPGTHSRSA